MDKRGQAFVVKGFAFAIFAFFMILATFSLIDVHKENLDSTRGTSSLNCPGTPGFDSTDYGNDTDFEKLVRRPTCFVTGMSFFYWNFSIIIALGVWLFSRFK